MRSFWGVKLGFGCGVFGGLNWGLGVGFLGVKLGFGCGDFLAGEEKLGEFVQARQVGGFDVWLLIMEWLERWMGVCR